MLSTNNSSSQFDAAEAAKQRQTIKKLTVGVSSILLGFAFAGATNAHADTTTPVNTNSESATTVSSDQMINNSASAQVLKSASTAASAASSSAASDVKTPVADSYEAAVNANLDTNSASSDANSAATTNDDAASSAVNVNLDTNSASSDANSSAAKDNAASSADQNSASATTNDNKVAAEKPAEEQLEVAPVEMTKYNAQPYGEAQREANAQAGQQIVNDVVSVFTSKTITGKIGAGINFIKDTINLIAHHPLAYQRYQNMTARQMRYANRQHDLALKEIRMKKAHKPQWQINFVIWQQRQLSNWQHNLEIQRQTMIGYLQAGNSANAFA